MFYKSPDVKRGPRLTLRCLAVLPCMSLAPLARFRCFAAVRVQLRSKNVAV